ncbi:hypothetical protein PG984_005109 [Apiospora sp. TS-2023a]
MSSNCHLDRLPDEILLYILDLAMTRDAPLYIDNPHADDRHPIIRCGQYSSLPPGMSPTRSVRPETPTSARYGATNEIGSAPTASAGGCDGSGDWPSSATDPSP